MQETFLPTLASMEPCSVLAENCIKNMFMGRRGCDRIVVGFTITYAVGAYNH